MGNTPNPKKVPRILGLTRSEAVKSLSDMYLHAAAWGTAHFKLLTEIDREDFTDMVKSGDLFHTWEKTIAICIQHGIHLSDAVLEGRYLLIRIIERKRLTTKDRERLGLLHRELANVFLRERAEEWVLVSDEYPVPVATGRYRLPPMTAPMSKKECASRFGVSVRRLIPTLEKLKVTFDQLTRERIRIAERDWPAPK